MTVLNLPLFAQVFSWVEDQAADNRTIESRYPKAKDGERYIIWEQNTWRDTTYEKAGVCGTGMCFAGYAAHLSGAQFLDKIHRPDWLALPPNMEPPRAALLYTTSSGIRSISIEDFAFTVLGFSNLEDGAHWSERLFDGNNSADDIRDILEDLFDSEGCLDEWHRLLTNLAVAG